MLVILLSRIQSHCAFSSGRNQERLPTANPMEWYFGSDIEDLAVPRDEDIFDRFPSPDSWSSWGKVGNFNSPKKFTLFGVEELLFSENTFPGEVEQWCTPSVSPCSRHAYPHEHSDFHLNDLSLIDEADDIFLHSIIEGNADATEGSDSSAKFTQTTSNDDLMSVVDYSGEMNHVQDHTNDVENHGFFPLVKELELEMFISQDHDDDMCEDMTDEDISMEETVLAELQKMTLQLAKKTRICFRDSLYRLAENSRHQSKCSQNGKEDLKNCELTTSSVQSRLRDSKANKSETNAIDRTVGTLLFNRKKCCDLVAASTSGPQCGDGSTRI